MSNKRQSLDNWLSWQETLHVKEIDLGLDRISIVAQRLDYLTPSFPIITVAGTNGKGSTVAFLESILRSAGYKTGSYTSPHLLRYNERIQINKQEVSDGEIIDAFETIDSARLSKPDNPVSLSYFEFGTLAAMHCFINNKVDVAILEVGLGGRLDASNIWDATLAIITNIGIDHIEWLGDNREDIGIEKAGIMRKDIPVVCGDPNPPESIKNEADRIGARLIQLGKDFEYQNKDEHWIWRDETSTLSLPLPSLPGEFQLNNASTAIAGLKTQAKQFRIENQHIKQGIKTASIVGRLQKIQKNPEIIIDVAHNPHAAKQLKQYLENHPVSGKTYALFSMLRDKDIKQVVSILKKNIDEWHIVALSGNRGLNLNELKTHLHELNSKSKIISHESVIEAKKSIKNMAKIEDRVVVFGSFLLVSEYLEISQSNEL